MNTVNLFLSDNPNFKLVKVIFPGSPKQYTYKTLEDVQLGDKVIVNSPSNGLTIVDVVDVVPGIESDLTFKYELKWLVQRVDMSNYDRAVAMEAQVQAELNKVEITKRRKELLKETKKTLGVAQFEAVKALVRL